VIKARVVPLPEFNPAVLTGDPNPRVLILHNVPRLEPAVQDAIGQFLTDGGGVLVTLGQRVEADLYNEQLYRGGEGFLPAQLDGIEGEEAQVSKAARPEPASFNHPTLELFRRVTIGGLGEARFPRWWKVNTPGRHAPGVVVGMLQSPTAKYPFLVERAYQAGRVLLCTVPLDNSWATNLTDLPAFVPLAHELVYYLAGARSAEFNLRPGQPLRYRLDTREPDLGDFTLQQPTEDARPLNSTPGVRGTFLAQVMRLDKGAFLVYDGARETGIYRLTTPEKSTIYYVVQADARESDLTPCTEEDRNRVSKLIPVTYQNERGKIVQAWTSTAHKEDFWRYFLIGLIALLCMEVWMTRRMVKNR
jgi:hypothetical protein